MAGEICQKKQVPQSAYFAGYATQRSHALPSSRGPPFFSFIQADKPDEPHASPQFIAQNIEAVGRSSSQAIGIMIHPNI